MSAKNDSLIRLKQGYENRTEAALTPSASGGEALSLARKRLAAQYRRDATMEGRLSLREREPATFAALRPPIRLSVGLYEQQKQARDAVDASEKDETV